MKFPLKRTAALLVAVLLAAPVFGLQGSAMTDEEREEYYANLRDRAGTSDSAGTGSSGSNNFKSSSKVSYSAMKSKIEEAQAVNQDVVGWLRIPNTNMNEPITFSSKNNAYYVNRDWKGTDYPNNDYTNYKITASYLDFKTKFGNTWKGGSRNFVIYGHNWTNLRSPMDIGNNPKHVMFGQLPSYTNMNWATEHPYVYFSTEKNEGIWKVFAVFYCELSTSFYYNQANPTKENFAKMLKEFQDRSMFDFSTEVNENDRIITLSTCTREYGSHANQRFVVMARLLRDGESETDKVTATVNSDMKKPKL